MRSLNKSSIIIVILNLLGWGALGFLGFKLNSDAKQIVSTYQELHTVSRGEENLKLTTDALAETAESRSMMTTAFLQGNALIPFIEKLEGLAKTAGIIFELDEPKPTASKPPLLDLNFRASGPFPALYHFLHLLENLPYRLEWQGVTWSSRGGTIWSGDFDLAVVSYTEANVTH